MSNSYIYCFIRKDLPVTHQLIQLGHVCHYAGSQSEKEFPPNMVLFEVQNEYELVEIAQDLHKQNINVFIFSEPDMRDECTAICTEVIKSDEKRQIFKDYRLYRDSK